MKFESIDQLGRKILFEDYPNRIISLVPSQSELLFDLGLKEKIIGITKFCIHPNELFVSKRRIGGTKNLDFSLIDSLQPDLIIANKEENNEADILKLAEKFKVWVSDVNTLEQALEMINEVSKITNCKIKGAEIISKINFELPALNKRVIYLIWNNPMMCVGKNTFIDAMISIAGFKNCITDLRYPEITIEKIKELNPDYLFLSTEPFPFNEKLAREFQEKIIIPQVKIVDGEMFSWYGSRLIQSINYFRKLNEDLKN